MAAAVVAVAGFDGLREPRAAEVAFAVADDFQRRGAGTRMLEQLAAIAADRGITRFDAEVMFGNRAMLGVFEGAGFAVRRRGSFGELTVSLDITPTEAVRERIDERDHFAAVASLRPLLAPSSIAVVGAAATPGNVGRAVLANIVAGGFQGVVTPVNRAGGVVCSRRAARSLAELEVAAGAGDHRRRGRRGARVCRRGGRERSEGAAGAPGRSRRRRRGVASSGSERLLEIVRGSGLRMVGPSSLGVVNTAAEVSLNATFSGASVRAGALAIGAQAVAPGIGLLGHAQARQMGVSMLVSVGGRADVSTNDLLEWCEADDRTAVVMLYVESFGNPERFTRVARRVSRRKPILVIKGRRSAERARSQARSHTAAALRGDAVIDAVLHQAGVLRFHSSEELFHVAQLFESQPLPSGRRIGIVSNSASVATLAADACATRGLEVERRARSAVSGAVGARRRSARVRRARARVARRRRHRRADGLLRRPSRGRPGGRSGGDLRGLAAGSPSRLWHLSCARTGGCPRAAARACRTTVFPESCVAVLARAAERREWLSRPLGVRPHYPDLDGTAARALISSVLDREPAGGWLSLADAEALLATHGIPVAASYRCRDLERALAVAQEIGGPVALKADFAAPAHASEIDAVLLGLEGESALRSGWRELERRVQTAGREWTGAIVQRLAAPGADVLVGAFSDPDLGPVIAVGLGGRQAGLGETVAFRLPPATDVEADELIDACHGVATAAGRVPGRRRARSRGAARADPALRAAAREVPEVVEADLNPVRCTTERLRRARHASANRAPAPGQARQDVVTGFVKQGPSP